VQSLNGGVWLVAGRAGVNYIFLITTQWGSTHMNKITHAFLVLVATMALFSCGGGSTAPKSSVSSSLSIVSSSSSCTNTNGTNTVTDCRDGQTYRTVVIGTQTWMARNLAYLPSVNAKADYSNKINVASYYVYDYDGTDVVKAKATSNYSTYGVLYSYPAALTACPTGWHLPDTTEWNTLDSVVGGTAKAGKALKTTTGWKDDASLIEDVSGYSEDSAYTIGIDSYGFSALPGGFYFDGFALNGTRGYWWAVTGAGSDYSYIWYLSYGYADAFFMADYRALGHSVRCLKDTP